jgi:hypothetical protein
MMKVVIILVRLAKRVIVGSVLSAACLLCQDRGGTPPGDGRALIGSVFSKANLSGSLEYWGKCNFKDFYPDYPKLKAVSRHGGSAVELLREMSSVDPEMRVSQDANGKIRMIEEDVPNDLLNVKIKHLRFPSEYHGPNVAIEAILHSPEVIAFREQHNIGPVGDWSTNFPFPSDAVVIDKRSVYGDLNDVTVEQALDHVLQTFQGFWLYENCKSQEGGRTVLFGFIENIPNASAARTPE